MFTSLLQTTIDILFEKIRFLTKISFFFRSKFFWHPTNPPPPSDFADTRNLRRKRYIRYNDENLLNLIYPLCCLLAYWLIYAITSSKFQFTTRMAQMQEQENWQEKGITTKILLWIACGFCKLCAPNIYLNRIHYHSVGT